MCRKRNVSPLQPHESDRYDQLCETLKSWDPANTLVASKLAKTFNVSGTEHATKSDC